MTYVNFHYNRDFIINNFCVNLKNPLIKCGGKCYLQKSLIESQTQEENIPNQTKEEKLNFDLISAYKNILAANQHSVFQYKKKLFIKETYSFFYLKKIFHPPQ